jgi:hypothetical protein
LLSTNAHAHSMSARAFDALIFDPDSMTKLNASKPEAEAFGWREDAAKSLQMVSHPLAVLMCKEVHCRTRRLSDFAMRSKNASATCGSSENRTRNASMAWSSAMPFGPPAVEFAISS